MTTVATLVDLPDANDPARYGAKAATLAALHTAAIPVPPGKVLAAPVDERHLPEVAIQLAQWATEAGHELLVVRSSSPHEDGHRSSFAGIYTSCFTPATAEHLGRALRRVLRSAQHDTALAYARARGATKDTMAVLIQPALRPAAAGVAAAQLTGHRLDEWRIEAVRGLAEPLVAGHLVGELHTGSTHTTARRATEQFAIVLPGTEQQLAMPPGEWVNLPTLNGPAAAKIATSADGLLRLHTPPSNLVNGTILPIQHRTELLHIIEHTAHALALPAVDLEWALHPDGAILVVQARPLTAALPPVTIEGTQRAGLPASPGIARGVIRHLDHHVDDSDVPGSILVCQALDTDAVGILLHRPAGLISTTGGTLSHTAIIARELAIPCITNVADAYTSLPPGTTVELNGTTGTITTIETTDPRQSTVDTDLNGTAVLAANTAPATGILTLRLRHANDSSDIHTDSSTGIFQPMITPCWPARPPDSRDLTLPGLGRLLLPGRAPVPHKIAAVSQNGRVLNRHALALEPAPTHIIWDWNGTLINDNDAVLAGVNAICATHRRNPLTLDTWRTIYQRPARHAYERLLGKELTEAELRHAIQTFNVHSAQRRRTCALAESARWALSYWAAAGNTQSLLSMTPHAELLADTNAHDVTFLFNAINGADDPQGDTKTELLHKHVANSQIDPTTAVLIGDSVDDAQVAHAASIRCVLVSSGTTSRARLDTTGAPVVSELADAIHLLGNATKTTAQ